MGKPIGIGELKVEPNSSIGNRFREVGVPQFGGFFWTYQRKVAFLKKGFVLRVIDCEDEDYVVALVIDPKTGEMV